MALDITNSNNDDVLQRMLEEQQRQRDARQTEELQQQAAQYYPQQNPQQRPDLQNERVNNPFLLQPNFGQGTNLAANLNAAIKPGDQSPPANQAFASVHDTEANAAIKSGYKSPPANQAFASVHDTEANAAIKSGYKSPPANQAFASIQDRIPNVPTKPQDQFAAVWFNAAEAITSKVTEGIQTGLLSNAKNSNKDKSISEQIEALKALTNGDISSATLLANLKYGDDASKTNFTDTAKKLLELNGNGNTNKVPAFLGIAKDALKADKLNPDQQSKVFSDIAKAYYPKLAPAQGDAFGALLAHLPNGESTQKLANEISSTLGDGKLDASKNAELLSKISNHLDEVKKDSNSPATKDLHRDLIANLMQANGIKDFQTANIAAKVLDHVPADQKENAIKLALGLAQEKDPLATLTGDAKTLAGKSGLSPKEAQEARKSITEAGIKLFQETAKQEGISLDRDKIIGLLSRGDQSLMGADGKFDKSDTERIAGKFTKDILDNPKTAEESAQRDYADALREGTLQSTIRQGAYSRITSEAPKIFGIRNRMLDQASSWQPGQGGGRIQGTMDQKYYENIGNSITQMRQGVMNQAYGQLSQSLSPEKMQSINDLSKLIQVSDIKAKNPITDLRQNDLKSLANLGQITKALQNDSNQFRIQNDRVASDKEHGKFDLFTDKETQQQFYRLTDNDGKQRFVIQDQAGKWQWLKGNDYNYNGKSYANVVNSFRDSKGIPTADNLNHFELTDTRQGEVNNKKINFEMYKDSLTGQQMYRIPNEDNSGYKYAVRQDDKQAWSWVKPLKSQTRETENNNQPNYYQQYQQTNQQFDGQQSRRARRLGRFGS